MTTEEISESATAETLTTKSYAPTPYEDVSWPIVGEFLNQCFFEVQQFEVLTKEGFQTDPMFNDYTPAGEAGRSGGPQGAFTPGVEEDDDESHIEQYKAEIERLKAECESAVEEARRVALAEGQALGAEAAQQEMAEMQGRYAAIIEDIGHQLNESIVDAEKKAATLGVDIARKLITAFTASHREYILPLVQEALSLSGGVTVQAIKVSEQDFEFLKLQDLSKHFNDPARAWNFEPDPTIKVGCVVSTSAGEIDYQVDHAWERIRDRMHQTLGVQAVPTSPETTLVEEAPVMPSETNTSDE
jgi:flagellar biosynthesis/type III secretory pathway protein FliH